MENWLDACENRWLTRIMRIAYKDSITNETIRQQVPMSNRNRVQTDAIKMVRACVMDESQQHLTGKRSRGRPKKKWMVCIEVDQGSMTIRCNKVWKNSRKTSIERLKDIAVDRQHGGT